MIKEEQRHKWRENPANADYLQEIRLIEHHESFKLCIRIEIREYPIYNIRKHNSLTYKSHY
jgi:hypothetical protein